jgi:hypothetical protein
VSRRSVSAAARAASRTATSTPTGIASNAYSVATYPVTVPSSENPAWAARSAKLGLSVRKLVMDTVRKPISR